MIAITRKVTDAIQEGDDLTQHDLLYNIYMELRKLNTHMQAITEEEIKELDI